MNTNKTPDAVAVDLVTRILSEITYNPSDLKVWSQQVGRTSIVRMQLHKADTPRAVGSQGAHIKALDVVVASIGLKGGMNLRTQLIDPVVGTPDKYGRFKASENWKKDEILRLLSDVAAATFREPVKVEIHDIDNATSTIELIVSKHENLAFVSALGGAIRVLFNAIGKANGRILSLDIFSENDPMPIR